MTQPSEGAPPRGDFGYLLGAVEVDGLRRFRVPASSPARSSSAGDVVHLQSNRASAPTPRQSRQRGGFVNQAKRRLIQSTAKLVDLGNPGPFPWSDDASRCFSARNSLICRVPLAPDQTGEFRSFHRLDFYLALDSNDVRFVRIEASLDAPFGTDRCTQGSHARDAVSAGASGFLSQTNHHVCFPRPLLDTSVRAY